MCRTAFDRLLAAVQEQKDAFGSETEFLYQRAMQLSVRTIHRWNISGKLDGTVKDLVEHSRVCRKGLYTVQAFPDYAVPAELL